MACPQPLAQTESALNRTKYDSCAYVASLVQSVSPLQYMLDPVMHEHCTKCRPERGIVGGTAVSHVSANMVDIENDLRGQTRPITQCPQYMYDPSTAGTVSQDYIKPVQHPRLDMSLNHLPPCQFAAYPRVPNLPFVQPPACAPK
jgi:hypothetical protein